MTRRTPLTSLKRINEINLTPLMDLTFILLITFIITFPLIEQGISINLPKGKAKPLTTVDNAQTVSIDIDGRIYFNNEFISIKDLKARLTEIGKLNPETPVMVRADEDIDYGSVVKILKIIRGAQITKMALVTRGEGDD